MQNEKYDRTVLELVMVINSANVSQTNKGEFFGYFLDHLVHRYVQIPFGMGDQFNAYLFPAAIRKSIDLLAGRLATLIGSADPVEAAGDLRYVITTTMESLAVASEGFALFMKGCICKTSNKLMLGLDTGLGADPKDRVMASRRRVVALGVLADALPRLDSNRKVL